MKVIFLIASLIAFPVISTAGNLMQFNDQYHCLGHFTFTIPKEIGNSIRQIRASYDLTEIETIGKLDQNEFGKLVKRQEVEASQKDRNGSPLRENVNRGTIFSVDETQNGGTIYGDFLSEGTAFKTETRFSHQMHAAFRDVVTQLGERLQPSQDSLPSHVAFCFEGGYVMGPLSTRERAQVFHAVMGDQVGVQFEIISEWLAAPDRPRFGGPI